MELKRRAPWAIDDEWVAQYLVETFEYRPADEEILSARFSRRDGRAIVADLREAAKLIVTDAQRDYAVYRKLSTVTLPDKQRMASHSLRLAHIDVLLRAGLEKADAAFFDEPDAGDTQELIDLLAIVPFDQLIQPSLFLNPNFGEASSGGGGADADLMVGHIII